MRAASLCLTIFSVASLLGACQAYHSDDPDSLSFSIPEGAVLSLNKPLTMPATATHVDIQDGKEIKHSDRYDYAINCRLDFRKFGPRVIEPETFNISRTEDGQNWVSEPAIMRYYTEVYLKSVQQTDIIKMVCQIYGDQTDRNFTVAEMQQSLGDLIDIRFAGKP